MRVVISMLTVAFGVGCGSDDPNSPSTDAPPGTTDSPTTPITTDTEDTDADTNVGAIVELIDGPIVLNSHGRALFGSVLLSDDTLFTTYQISTSKDVGPTSITGGKNLYFRTFDRNLQETQGEELAIDVMSTSPMNWDGDLGDQKLVLISDSIYMVALIKGHDAPGFFEFDHNFNIVNGPAYIGMDDINLEKPLDMGFGHDGFSLFAQFFYQNGSDNPKDWGASVYQISLELEELNSNVVYPEEGRFVTGTSIVFVQAGDMGFASDGLQSFSTNLDYGNPKRVSVHTFRLDPGLNLIPGTTQDVVSRELDTYFPVGTSYNSKHQLWIVAYTMENFEGEHGFKGATELGPSFFEVMDADFNSLATVAVNGGEPAFRVMTATIDDDLYVVYDEMDKDAYVGVSEAKLERYRLTAP